MIIYSTLHELDEKSEKCVVVAFRFILHEICSQTMMLRVIEITKHLTAPTSAVNLPTSAQIFLFFASCCYDFAHGLLAKLERVVVKSDKTFKIMKMMCSQRTETTWITSR